MLQFIEERLTTPVRGEYDVIVAGGGPAGVCAALAAARNGMKVLLVERFSCLGGMWTSGLVNPLFDYENKGGIVREIVDIINSAGMNDHSGPMYTFDIEYMKLALDRLLREAGVKVLFHTAFAAPLLSGENNIYGITVENKGGRSAYLAKRVIDCTGDGDVAARAGAPFHIGRDSDGACQPMTLMFTISHMDYVQRANNPYSSHTDLYHVMCDGLAAAGVKEYTFNFENPWLLKLPGLHRGVLQMTHMRGYDPLDPDQLSLAEAEGRERVWEALTFFRRYCPEFKNAQIEQTATIIGVRESRRIIGEYELTLDDVTSGRKFRDGIATCCFGVDIHEPDGKAQAVGIVSKPYQIPYRCLVPKNVGNLLTAGRCISGSHEAHGSYRVTGDCAAMGQAAGTAAALSVIKNVSPRELDGAAVAEKMSDDGARV